MDKSYAQRLRLWRKGKNLTLRSLGKEISFSHSYIGDIEAGRTEPSRNFLNSLTEKYGVSADWVLHGTGDPLVKASSESSTSLPSSRRAFDAGFLMICGGQVASVYADLGKTLSTEAHFDDAVWLANELMKRMADPGDGDELEALLPELKTALKQRLRELQQEPR